MNLDGLQNACVLLKTSTKIVDRKKAAESILELISNNDGICRALDYNSMHKERDKDKLTWTGLFNEVKDYFSKETEKLSVSHSGNLVKTFYLSVVDRVLQKGTCNRPWILWNRIFEFITSHLNQEVYAVVYGTSLFCMLQNFLSTEAYVSIIDASSWTDLIKLLLKVYGKYDIPTSTLLQCLNISILEGSNHPLTIRTLRSEVVPFYETVFSADKSRNRSHIVLFLRGVTGLCRRNAVEFRGILCKLGELIIPSVLYSASSVSDEEGALVEFLLVQLQLHSPCDIDMKSPAFYSDDPKKWVEILKSIYSFCLDTIEEIAAKKSNPFHKDLNASDKLIVLAAKCTKQIFDSQLEEHSSSGDEDEPNPVKKPMRYRSFNNVLTEVCSRMTPGESQIIWMNYLTAVLIEFPGLVGGRMNYSCLFNMGLGFLNSNFGTRREVYLFFLCLLKTEKYLIHIDVLKSRSKSWENVWDISLRSLSMPGPISEAMELLRNLLIEVQPSNVNGLLILYVQGSMPVTSPSLHLLAEYLSRCSLPLYMGSTGERVGNGGVNIGIEIASTSCPRLSLIQWLVHTEEEPELGYEPLISAILCSLLVRQTHNLIYAEKFCHRPNSCIRIPSELSQYEIVYDDFEKVILNCCFVDVPGESGGEREEANAQESLLLSLMPTAPGRLVEALQEDFEKVPVFDNSSSEFMKKFSQLNYRVALYLSVLNVLEKHSIGNGDSLGFRTNLEKLLDKGLSRCMETAIEFITKGKDKSASQVQEIISIMRNLLRSGHLCDKLKSVLSQRFPQQMQELLKKVYRSNLTRYIERAANNLGDNTVMFGGQDILARLYFSSSGSETSGVSEYRRIELAALEGLNCLIDYGVICDHRTDLFTDILKDCVSEAYNSAIPFVFEFSSDLVSRLTPVLVSGSCSELLTLITNLLQKMCRGFYQIPQCSVRLWELFADITGITAKDSEVNKKNLMILVGTLSGFMKTGTAYGSSISVGQAGFRALAEVAKNDPHLSWSVFTPKVGFPVWVLHELYEFLNNASHQIRLFAAQTICLMFQHSAPPTHVIGDSQEPGSETETLVYKRAEHYDKIFQFFQKTFTIPSSLKPEEITEEAVNRTSVAIVCLTRLIFAYPFIQKKSLFALLKLVKLKKIEVTLVKRALDYASSTAAKTMCCHVSYLLQQWLQLNYSIEDFPHTFFGCETMGSFYNKFRKEISVEFFQKNDTEGLTKFAKFFNLETLDLIKECYGMLMARIVPGLSVYTTKHAAPPRGNETITQLQETQKRLTAALGGKKETESLMMTSLGDVVLQLVSLVFDPLIPSAWGCPEIRLPEPAPPFHEETWIDTSMNFLKEASSRKDISIVAFLATYSAKSIYDTLQTLIIRVHNAHDSLEKFWRLHQFAYFVKQLLQEPHLIFNQMKEYVCQFVVYAYLRLLNSETGEDTYSMYLRHALIYLISELVLILTLSYKEEMKQYYYAIVNGLVSSSIKYPDLIEPTKKPLDLLLKNYAEDYSECIISLDPFPSSIAEFQEYRDIYSQRKYGQQRRADWPLQKELRSCLSEIQISNGSCTKERLEFLRDLLSKKKKDLERVVRSLEGKQFSDDCTNDVLHNLIQMLVGVIKSGTDEDAALEACRCLGEIGPVDLSVLVLPVCPSRKEIKKMVSSITTVVEIAAEYLKSDDIRVVSTTGEVLRSLCQMGECAELLMKEMSKTRLDAILKPFKTAHPVPNKDEKVFAGQLETKLGLNEMDEFMDYPTWITQLTCGLIECLKTDDSLTARLLPLCKIKVDFCQQVLPFVIYVILYSGRNNPLIRKTLSGYFRNFFGKFLHNQASMSECSRSFTPIIGANQVSIFLNKLALRSLLGVVQFLRKHQAPQEFKGSVRLTPWDNNLWLEVNYLELAKAAQHCGAFLTSILYTEIAATDLDMGGTIHIDDIGDEDPMESFYSQGNALLPKSRGESFEKLLLKAYTSIGEPDAVYGCGPARFSDNMMNVRHLQQRMQWGRVLSACDGNAVDSESVIESGVGASMKEMGLYNTLWTYLQGIEVRETVLDQELAEIQFECGWRLSKWNLHCDKATYVKDGSLSQSGKGHGMLQRYIYESVQTGIASDVVNHIENVRRGYTSVAKDLRHASIESSENLYGFLSQLQMLRVVEDFFHMETPDSMNVTDFLLKWKLQDRINASDFKFQEPILYLRSILLRSYDRRHPRMDLESAYDDCMLELLSKARDSGRLGFAENCAACISVTSDRINKKDFEVAKNHWARGDQDIARHILSRQLKKSSQDGCDLYPLMLLVYGEWLSETMSERPSVILDKYFLRSCQIYEKRIGTSQAETSKANFVLAKYADAQYQNITKYVKSEFFTQKIAHYEKAIVDGAAIANSTDMDSRKTAIVLRKQSTIDEEEIRVTFEQRQKFLVLALRHYLRGLKDSNDQDLLIFRAVALWLENGDAVDSVNSRPVNDIFKQETMPSYKYIVVLHQLCARMNTTSKGMTDILTSIIVKCAQQHPYHTMPVLLTQALLHKDQEIGRNVSHKQLEDRVKAAAKLVDFFKKDKKLGPLAQKMTKLWEALISLANFHDQRSSTGSVNMPNTAIIRSLPELEIVAVPTSAVPVSMAAEYHENIVGIKSFDYVYNLVGGINSPKRISCMGTNGVKFNMLLKGQDDLRQDAVMQQVFGVMNKLLLAESKTKARRLHVRTYKVVPLSQRSGILEWCENTQTFGDYLVNNNTGAHQKYRPHDYTPQECRRKMLEVKDCGDNDKKYGNFMTIMEHFKPVFRHFFFENFKDAGTFFERRLAYTRSVATNSMVGYVLGLGDRHVLNILVDNTTAELIHIDLGNDMVFADKCVSEYNSRMHRIAMLLYGVAFEQGRILPTPETIPFRLTRDVVDGMGVSGVEGVFRKSCETTLDVLRNNSEIILTILEVLLYDPLYMWTLTTDRMKKVQPAENGRGASTKRGNGNTSTDLGNNTATGAPNGERNSLAARVLLRLRQKLDGIEDGGSSGSMLSVPGHVSLLIQRALDPEKLSRLFPGWQPYL